MKFPKEIKVYIFTDNGGEEFVSIENGEAENGQNVAIYQLKVVRTKRITEELV